jgi:hypothetical protein
MARVTVRAGALRPQNPGHVHGESRTGALVCGPGRAIVQSDCLQGSGGLEAVVYEPYRHGAFPHGGRGALN